MREPSPGGIFLFFAFVFPIAKAGFSAVMIPIPVSMNHRQCKHSPPRASLPTHSSLPPFFPFFGGCERPFCLVKTSPVPPFLEFLPLGSRCLPLHLVGLVALPEREGGGEVAGQELDLLDAGDQGLVDSLLVLHAVLADLLLLYREFTLATPPPSLRLGWWSWDETYRGLLALLEEGLLTGLLLLLLADEVLGLGDLLDLLGVKAGDVDLVRGRDDVAGVDPAEGHAVDLEGTRDEKDTLVEGLEEDDALAAEAAGEQDQDRTGLEGRAGAPGADSLAGLLSESRSAFPFMCNWCCSSRLRCSPWVARGRRLCPPPPTCIVFIPSHPPSRS